MKRRAIPAFGAALVAASLSLLVGIGGCTRLPEPDSPGAKLYKERCATGCHGAYAPGSMKFQMWKMMVQRMQGEIVRHGMPPLTDDEVSTLLDYLKRHAAS